MNDRLPLLVMLPGWSMDEKVFAPLFEAMPDQPVLVLELPGYVSQEPDEAQAWSRSSTLVEYLLGQLPEEPCVLAGWSLGGSLALLLANAHPERILGVILLACNPCFVAQGDRPGMSLELFSRFQEGINHDVKLTLRRFRQLCCQGSPEARSRIRWLHETADYRGHDQALCEGLEWLAVDYFEYMEALTVPCLSVLAVNDALVPVNLASSLAGRVSVIEESSHLLFVDQPLPVAAAITGFVRTLQGNI